MTYGQLLQLRFVQLPQYIIFAYLMYKIIMTSKFHKFSYDKALMYFILVFLSLVSILRGYLAGYSYTIKPLVITSIVFILDIAEIDTSIFVNFFKFIFYLLIVEYFLAYSGIYNGHLHRFGFIRPFGLFMDLQLLSLFIVSGFFTFGYSKVAGFLSIVFMGFQTIVAYLVMVFKFINKFVLLIGLIFITILLWKVGHLDTDINGISMISVILRVLKSHLDWPSLLFGYSVKSVVDLEELYGLAADFGPIRIGYLYGFIWVFFMILNLRKYNKIILLAFLSGVIHYPVVFGVLGILILMLNLKYIESVKNQKVKVKKLKLFDLKIVSVKKVYRLYDY